MERPKELVPLPPTGVAGEEMSHIKDILSQFFYGDGKIPVVFKMILASRYTVHVLVVFPLSYLVREK